MASTARLLVIIGSGEMTPGMRKVHREVLTRLAGTQPEASSLRAVTIDTPYGFQANADALTAQTLDYFARLGLDMEAASLRRADADALAREKAISRIRAADFVFSGPGSPTYALRHWASTPVPELLAAKLLGGGALVLASAAALTLGRFTVPVYEIYKSGADPYWADGLGILSRVGLEVAVVPHWDNREGGDHDTRYCFLGEARLALLEQRLPATTFILGVDEHTALTIDLGEQRAHVSGRGNVTVRRAGHESIFGAGEEMTLTQLRAAAGVGDQEPAAGVARPGQESPGRDSGAQVLARRVLELEAEARLLAGRAELVEPLISALLEGRAEARRRGDWAAADGIRDRLRVLGIELTDTADGQTAYRLPDGPRPA